MKERSYKITGLDCQNCANKVGEHLKKELGLEEVSIDILTENIYVKGDKTEISDLQPIIDKYEDGVVLSTESEPEEEGEMKEFIIKGIRVLVSLTLVLLGLFVFNEENYGLWVNLAVNLIAYVIVAYDIYIASVKTIIREKNPFDENFLMVIASLGAFALRFFGPAHNEFFDATLLMILYQIGDGIEDIATERSKRAIRKAGAKRPQIAHKKADDGYIDVKPESLEIDDIIMLKAGEIVPADGLVIEGDGLMDLSSLTGEFDPKTAKAGEEVYSGTILSEGSLMVRVNKIYADSTSAKIQKLIEQSASSKSKTDKFIAKFAKVYTPIVVVLAVILAVFPPLIIGYNDAEVWNRFIYVGLCFLVVSCPCSIVISVPLAFFSGMGLASKNGIVVKGSSFFDEVNEIKYLATDKTGTLTKGKFDIKSIHPEGVDESLFMEYLEAAESRSNHPIAVAILGDKNIDDFQQEITSYQEVKGKGISLVYKNKNLVAGRVSFLEENNIKVPEFEAGNATSVCLAIDGKFAGYILLEDELKEEAKPLVDSLKSDGVKTILLSGDREGSVKEVATSLGLDGYKANLLPEQKCECIKEYLEKGKVCYMGDGINDAASIKLASVGVAMGAKGSDLAIENADIIIVNDDLSSFKKLRQISRKTRNRAIFNIVVALLVKLVFMVLALTIPGFPLSIAVIADTGLLVLLITSSLLLLNAKVK